MRVSGDGDDGDDGVEGDDGGGGGGVEVPNRKMDSARGCCPAIGCSSRRSTTRVADTHSTVREKRTWRRVWFGDTIAAVRGLPDDGSAVGVVERRCGDVAGAGLDAGVTLDDAGNSGAQPTSLLPLLATLAVVVAVEAAVVVVVVELLVVSPLAVPATSTLRFRHDRSGRLRWDGFLRGATL